MNQPYSFSSSDASHSRAMQLGAVRLRPAFDVVNRP
jgi:hypothetical protein